MARYARETWYIVVLCILAAIPFLPAMQGSLTNWDDDINITTNPYVRGGFSEGLVPLLTQPYLRLYLPVTYATWWTGFHLWGADGLGYHLLNLACHLASVALLYSILHRILKTRWPALLAAAWWAVHPVNVEAVAWITGLKDVLSVMLALLSWRLYIAYSESSSSKGDEGKSESAAAITAQVRRGRIYFAGALAAFCLACLSKPGVVLFPAVLAAYDLLIARRKPGELLPLALFLLPVLFVAGLTWSIHDPTEAGVSATMGIKARLAVAADSGIFYIEKSLWPAGLCPVYGRTARHALASGVPWVNLALVAGLVVLVVWSNPRWKLAGAVFLAGLIPISGLVPFGYQAYSTVADRYAYLPAIGLALVLGDLLERLRLRDPRAGARDAVLTAVVGVWIVVLGALAWVQSSVWTDSLSLWTRVMEINQRPSAAVRANYGSALFRAGRAAEAVEVLNRCVAERPDYLRGQYNLACALHAQANQGDRAALERARTLYHLVLQADPRHVNAMVGLAALEAAEDNLAACVALCRQALEVDPGNAMARVNLGLALLKLRRPAEAVKPLQEAVLADPHDAEARLYLAQALEASGQRDAARAEYQRLAETRRRKGN